MIVSSLVVGPFLENSYLVVDERSRDAILVDPGDEGERLIANVESHHARLTAIWLTHAHLDHIGGIAAVHRKWPVPIYLHMLDAPLYVAGARQAAQYGVPFEQPPAADRELAEGDTMTVGDLSFNVMHLPGHAPGHVVFHGHGAVFGGDVLFAGSVGRTDLPGSNPAQLEASLARLAELPPETVVYSGHGSATSIGAELASNPFLNGVARVPRR